MSLKLEKWRVDVVVQLFIGDTGHVYTENLTDTLVVEEDLGPDFSNFTVVRSRNFYLVLRCNNDCFVRLPKELGELHLMP